MNPDDLDKAIFEQHWVHARHIESERMWIMGIWLGVTGWMLREIWMVENSHSWVLKALKSISLVHLVITLAVLIITFKLQLEYSRHLESIRKMTSNFPQYKVQLCGVWQMIQPDSPGLVTALLTIGGVFSAILLAGVVFDTVLFFSHRGYNLYLYGLRFWLQITCIYVVLFFVYQTIFRSLEDKIRNKLKEKIERSRVDIETSVANEEE